MSRVATCDCGIAFVKGDDVHEQRHLRLHSDVELGPTLPLLSTASSVCFQGAFKVVKIDDSSLHRVRVEAATLAMTARQETPQYPAGYDGSYTSGQLNVYALLDGLRAIGFVLIGRTEQSWRLCWTDPDRATLCERLPDTLPRYVVGRVWIAVSCRRVGLSRALVASIAASRGVAVTDFAFATPLTHGGRALVQRLCGSQWYAVGDRLSLADILQNEGTATNWRGVRAQCLTRLAADKVAGRR
jgi:hypothetical protein